MSQSFEGLSGKVITPCSNEYEQARQEWNRAIQKFPMVLVYCYSVEDVRNAVCWAVCNGIKIRIRSGGHHYQGYSTGDDVLVIDVSHMKQLKLDEADNSVFLQSGVENREIYDYLGAREYPFPGGTCPTVGVSGYTLGGGWGYSSRYLGLGCDSLIALEMIDYQGNLLKAENNHNTDLFWACRGAGGGNFGIVTSMTFKLPAKIAQVTLIELEYLDASSSVMARFLNIWQEWLTALDQRMTINASLYNSGDDGKGIYGKGLFYGSASEAAQILQPFEMSGVALSLKEMSFLEAMQQIQDVYPNSEKFQSTGRFVNRKYSMKELTIIAQLIDERAKGSVYCAVSVYALGGKVKEVGRECTAFYYRDASYIMGIQSVWEEDRYASINRFWLYKKFQYLKQLTSGSYVNFPYNCLADYEEEYYGENMCRLRQIARQYDPLNIFSFPQAIR